MCNIGIDLKKTQPKNFHIIFAKLQEIELPGLCTVIECFVIEAKHCQDCSGGRNICLSNNASFFSSFSGMEYHKQGGLRKLGFGRERMGNGRTFTSIAQSQHPLTNRTQNY